MYVKSKANIVTNHGLRRELPWCTGACIPWFGISELGSVLLELPIPLELHLLVLATPFDPISAESVTPYPIISSQQNLSTANIDQNKYKRESIHTFSSLKINKFFVWQHYLVWSIIYQNWSFIPRTIARCNCIHRRRISKWCLQGNQNCQSHWSIEQVRMRADNFKTLEWHKNTIFNIWQPFLEAFCGYGWEDLRFGRGGGTCAVVPFFWTFKKYFCAWLRICKNTILKQTIGPPKSNKFPTQKTELLASKPE